MNKYSKQILIISLATSLCLAGLILFELVKDKKIRTDDKAEVITKNTMFIKSPDFKNNESLPAKFTCDGLGVSPELIFAGIPAEAQSLAFIYDDPDSVPPFFTHWIAWNISTATERILSGTIPEGAAVGKNDFGKNNYGGPCPPSGAHRYTFTLYALDTVLDISPDSGREALLSAMQGHVIDTAELVGIYGR